MTIQQRDYRHETRTTVRTRDRDALDALSRRARTRTRKITRDILAGRQDPDAALYPRPRAVLWD